ncbi:MAG: hypothetical protein IJK71_11375 [Clostridia bacterium]|nr:hypothetical protein [Clostridia bacterium]
MQAEKKTFTKAEIEIIRFEKTDVIATSTQDVGAGEGYDTGDGASLD